MPELGEAERARINQSLCSHRKAIHELFKIFDGAPTSTSSLEKVSWNAVLKLGDQLSQQATAVGFLCTGGLTDVELLEKGMTNYFNIVRFILFLSHLSKENGGPTLASCVYVCVKQILECSLNLFTECVAAYGSSDGNNKTLISGRVASVLEACSSMRKIPVTNTTAIGRAMARIGVSVKEVLGKMNELKEEDGGGDGLVMELSKKEMVIARLVKLVVSDCLQLQKEAIRSITNLTKVEMEGCSAELVISLEKVLRLSEEIGMLIGEMGVAIYPPQKGEILRRTSVSIRKALEESEAELTSLPIDRKSFFQACIDLRSSATGLESGLLENDEKCSGT